MEAKGLLPSFLLEFWQANFQSKYDKLVFEPPHDKTNKTVHLDWFRCYHTRCDNRHRIVSRWIQLDYCFFLISQSDTALHKF